MIIQWKKSGPTEFVAVWQGHHLSLQFSPTPTRPPWIVSVDGRRIHTIDDGVRPAQWWTPISAMEAMDAVANRIIIRQGGYVAAEQRPRSEERIVRHGGL